MKSSPASEGLGVPSPINVTRACRISSSSQSRSPADCPWEQLWLARVLRNASRQVCTDRPSEADHWLAPSRWNFCPSSKTKIYCRTFASEEHNCARNWRASRQASILCERYGEKG